MNAIDAASPYQKIDAAYWARGFLVGDLHGCYNMLMTKLERQHFDQKRDLLIALGDFIDRGPQSEACLPLLENPCFVPYAGITSKWRLMPCAPVTIGCGWLTAGGGFIN